MLLYFEFDGRRVNANVTWPEGEGTIAVHITDKKVASEFPTDLLFDINEANKISYIEENPSDERLTELQSVIARKLTEQVR